ncbi:MAG TPA: hypothetical protein VMH90_00630, partial [Thermoplasmata archaeon]|nr:hypothetical protein [Thermoplasmata archaeon]
MSGGRSGRGRRWNQVIRWAIPVCLAAILLPTGLGSGFTSAAVRPLPPNAPATSFGERSADGSGPIPAHRLADALVPGSIGEVGPSRTDVGVATSGRTVGFNPADPKSAADVWAAAEQARRGVGPGPSGAAGSSAAGMPGRVTTAPPMGARRPSSSATGFAGYVNDSGDRRGMGNVSLTETSPVYCGPSNCGGATTDATGYFWIGCEAPGGLGNDYALHVTGVSWWMDNVSYDVCVANRTTFIGTIFLVREGTAYGTVEEAGTGVPVSQVRVSSISRDATTLGNVNGITGSAGTFEI